jgi:hypothetical protein
VAVIIEEDQSERGGFALIDLGRKVNGPLRFSFRRLDTEPRNLGTGGWQSETTWLGPDRIVRSDPTTIVRFGPEVVDQISELVLIEIALDGFGIIEKVNWPFLMKSSRSLPSVRIQAPRPNTVEDVTLRSIKAFALKEATPEPTPVSMRSARNNPKTSMPEPHLDAAPPRADAPVVEKPGPQEVPASPVDAPVVDMSLESEFRTVLAVDRAIENWQQDTLESGFERATAERLAAEDRAAADKAVSDRAIAERATAERLAAEDRAAADKAVSDRAIAERATAERLAAEFAEHMAAEAAAGRWSQPPAIQRRESFFKSRKVKIFAVAVVAVAVGFASFLVEPLGFNKFRFWDPYRNFPYFEAGNLAGRTFNGPYRGPFSPSMIEWVIINPDSKDHNIELSADGDWIVLSQRRAYIPGGQRTTIQIRLGSGSRSLPPGQYNGGVIIFEPRSGLRTSDLVRLEISRN